MLKIPPGPLSMGTAAALERALTDIFRQLLPFKQAGFGIQFQGGLFTGEGNTEAAINKKFWARITEVSGDRYGWQEILPNTTTAWFDHTGGRRGTPSKNPAYALNGETVSVDDRVELKRARFDPVYDWMYVFGSGAGDGCFDAEVTGSDHLGHYSWREMCKSDNGNYLVKADGRSGTTTCNWAWEKTNNWEVPNGVIVRMCPRSIECTSSSSSSSSSSLSSGCDTNYEFVCPDTSYLVRLTGDEPGIAGFLDGYLQIWDPATLQFVDGERVFIVDATS